LPATLLTAMRIALDRVRVIATSATSATPPAGIRR
jgi:hypothetical protein